MNYLYSLTLIVLLPLNLLAYDDFDLDGVEDSQDRCPNTLITDLVDINGCSIKSLVSPHHYDIILGTSYSQVNYNTNEKTNNINSTMQVDYYYKNFSLQLSSSYFTSKSKTYSSKGFNDTYLSAYYRFSLFESLSLRVGGGIVLPTYKSGLGNNNTDYASSVNLSYTLKGLNLFGGYRYTLINNDDIKGVVSYQDSASLYGGIGFYPSSQLYLSASYNKSDSIYKGVVPIENASAYAYYTFSQHWFSTLSYAYGLSSSASHHYLSIRFGYYY